MSNSYYTYRIRITNLDRVQVEVRDPQNQVIKEPEGEFGYHDELIQQRITAQVEKAQQEKLTNKEDIKLFGELLFNTLFDGSLRHNFIDLYNKAVHQEKKLLRIELDVDEKRMPVVATLPWEFMRVPTEFNLGTLWLGTAPDIIFSRRRALWNVPEPIQLEPGEKLRIAYVVAAPADLGAIKYEKVQENLEKLAAEMSLHIQLLPVVNPATPDAVDAILEQEPHIFHFSGHGRLLHENGAAKGQLALVDDFFNTALWVDADFFSDLFNTHRPGIVYLDACEGASSSSSQAFVSVASHVVAQNIPVVLAMQYEVPNIVAMRFAISFYQRLVAGDPVDRAAQNGRRTIALNTQYKSRDFATPVLFMRVADGHLFSRPSGNTAVPAIAAAPVANSATSVPLTAEAASLPKLIAEKFDLQGIRALCGAVGVDIEDLGSSGKAGKAQDLFGKAERTYRLDALVKAMAASIPDLLPEIKANLHVFMERLKPRELTSMCQELGLDCAALMLDSAGLLGYEANKHIRTERTQALQDYMVSNGRYPELVQALKPHLPHTDLSLFET